MKILKENTLNIFCDASISSARNNNGFVLGCPGALLVEVRDGKFNTLYNSNNVLCGTTNNHSEINAILLGVKEALKYKNNSYTCINLFSDSRICILGLREWIFAWMNRMTDEGIILTSSGTPVSNQDVISEIMHTIVTKNLNIRLYHQKGHVTSSDTSLIYAKDLFFTSNNIILDLEEVQLISYYNNMIDKITKEILQSNFNNDYRPLRSIIQYPIGCNDIGTYKKLIGVDC